ncbi:CoA ester lyase [Nocardioides zeae]|uniref:CoA ester lyase n=1 Tax=Nocardioides imazamoxiresistens TaxID=3231893 RepID=A0ABU3PSJ6_9ACTN|nr:CoA ester lyase [Nocardioides zeae]MDT9592174.1 CoA ester lyase [Nocardioides zeae]
MRTAVTARSWLFTPGDRERLFDKASASNADAVVLDLEDAVAPHAKATARADVCDWLRVGGRAWVRINAADTTWFDEDLIALTDAPGLAGVMLAKAEDPDAVHEITRQIRRDVDVVALVETARGVRRAEELAAVQSTTRLAFGALDLAADLGVDPDEDDALLLARSTLVLASRVAGLPAPVDGVTRATTDAAAIVRDARRSRSLGFGAKLCIHPAQVDLVNAGFAPTEAEVEWAREVLETAGAGGVGTDARGQMIDKPVVDRARGIVQAAGEDR